MTQSQAASQKHDNKVQGSAAVGGPNNPKPVSKNAAAAKPVPGKPATKTAPAPGAKVVVAKPAVAVVANVGIGSAKF